MARPPLYDWTTIDPILIADPRPLPELAVSLRVPMETLRTRRKKLRRDASRTPRLTPPDEELAAGLTITAQKRLQSLKRQEEITDRERATIAVMAETTKAVVGRHRKRIAEGQQLVERLYQELWEATKHREDIEAAVEEETEFRADNGAIVVDRKRRERMLRAVALPERASTLGSLTQALERLIKLEREAWGVPIAQVPDPDDPANAGRQRSIEEQAYTESMLALSESLRKRLAEPEDPGDADPAAP